MKHIFVTNKKVIKITQGKKTNYCFFEKYDFITQYLHRNNFVIKMV
jgi:hypothetical protein